MKKLGLVALLTLSACSGPQEVEKNKSHLVANNPAELNGVLVEYGLNGADTEIEVFELRGDYTLSEFGGLMGCSSSETFPDYEKDGVLDFRFQAASHVFDEGGFPPVVEAKYIAVGSRFHLFPMEFRLLQYGAQLGL